MKGILITGAICAAFAAVYFYVAKNTTWGASLPS